MVLDRDDLWWLLWVSAWLSNIYFFVLSSNCPDLHLLESESFGFLKSWDGRRASVLLLDERVHPHLEDVVLAGVVPQHVLLVLAKVVALKVRTSVRPGGRHHRVDPLLEVELGKVVLLLPVLVLRVRHEPADLALVSRHTHARLFELLVCLHKNTS